MPHKSWRKNTSVIATLAQEPQAYSFIQTVRLIERSMMVKSSSASMEFNKSYSMGRFTPPNREFVRFKNNQALVFPSTEIRSLKPVKTALTNEQWEIVTNFMGITGSQGVMPFSFTELLLQRLKQKDPSLLAFLDLFNHRTISLFYQASVKYSLPISYERKQLPNNNTQDGFRDSVTQALRSLIGMGTKGLDSQLTINSESLIFYGGLFSQQVRTASGLKQILRSYFDVPIEMEEFLGRWQDIIDDIRTRLPDQNNIKGQSVCLGRSAMLGKRGWFAQGKVRIVIGPLNGEQFQRFAPGGKALKEINELVRMYIGLENDYDFSILVNRSDIPERVKLSAKKKPVMGWSTWLSGQSNTSKKDNKTIKISISASQIKENYSHTI